MFILIDKEASFVIIHWK